MTDIAETVKSADTAETIEDATVLVQDDLVEDVSIDGMCGVY